MGSLVERCVWSHHATPWSVRPMVVAYPALVLAAPVHCWTIRSALGRRPGRTLAGTVPSLLSMLPFFNRMVGLYEDRVKRAQ